MPKTLDDLRDHLFAALDALRDKDKPMEIERAKAISEIAETVIKSAMAEVQYVRALGNQDLRLPVFGVEPAEIPGIPKLGAVRTHRIK